MQLRLKGTGAGETVRIESTLDGFDEIAELVAGVARGKGIGMTDTTISNFLALGIDVESEPTGFPHGSTAGSFSTRETSTTEAQ